MLNIETLTVDAKNAATKEYFAAVTGVNIDEKDTGAFVTLMERPMQSRYFLSNRQTR